MRRGSPAPSAPAPGTAPRRSAMRCSPGPAVRRRHHRDQRLGDRRHRPGRRGGQTCAASPSSGDGGCDTHAERVVRVLQVNQGSPGAGMSFASCVAPAGAEEQRPLQSRIGEVEDGEQVDVVTAGDRVGEGGPYGKAVAKAAQGSRSGPTSASALSVGSRFLRFVTRSSPASLTRLGGGVAERARASPARSSDWGRSLISTSRAGGMSLSARSITSRCPANVPATRLSCWMDGDDVVPLLVKDADEVVEAGEQLADLRVHVRTTRC